MEKKRQGLQLQTHQVASELQRSGEPRAAASHMDKCPPQQDWGILAALTWDHSTGWA